MKYGQKTRVIVAVVLIIVSTWVLLPRWWSDISSNGTVNARLVSVVSPIEGTVVRTPPDVGTIVKRGQILTEVTYDTEALSLLAQLDTERAALRARIEALKQRISALSELRVRLELQAGDFQSGMVQRLGYQIGEAKASFMEWQATDRERTLNLERVRSLVDKGMLPKSQLDLAQASKEQSAQHVAGSKESLDRLNQELSAARKGIFLDEGRNDVPYSQQRIDEIAISELDLKSELAEAVARLQPVEDRFEQESHRSAERATATVKSSIDGTVWRRVVTEQEPVARAQELLKLLDCNTLNVEVAIPEGDADYIDMGSKVEVRLQGSVEKFTGVVQDIRGPRSVTLNVEYVATPPELKRNQVLATVSLSVSQLQTRSRVFCGVGRRAEVYFPRRLGPVLGSITRFLSG